MSQTREQNTSPSKQQSAMEQLNSGTSLRSIEEIQDKVMGWVEISDSLEEIARFDMLEILQDWMNTDLTSQADEIQELVEECF